MYEFFFGNYLHWQVMILCLCAFLAGVNKNGMPGVGIIMVPLMAMAFPARESTGLILPILGMADIFAITYFHKHAKWKIVLKLLPWALSGVVTGSIIIRFISDKQLKPIIGIIVLVMLITSFVRKRMQKGEELKVPSHPAFAATMGFAAGMTSQMANAAGPIMVIYLLAMQLPKEEYVGTGAWFFMILNWTKMPFYIWEGRITLDSVRADLLMIPFIAIGAATGILILRKLPQKWFNIILQVLALAATLKLCWSIKDLL